MFDTLPRTLARPLPRSPAGPAPAVIPLRFDLRGGQRLGMTSRVGRLAAAHDWLVEGLEVGFFVPCDADSEAILNGDQLPK
ncbi:MAG: hypothetical protein CML66_14590 [Rhodobacteraceae bacterium]|nr:hypothetical protein [Paracoccaceae bacterium]MAY47145.1 hypothetical protein [Paracoccaceae bacterium]